LAFCSDWCRVQCIGSLLQREVEDNSLVTITLPWNHWRLCEC
jgi:hypothetical protein